jgi:hypothetical protein
MKQRLLIKNIFLYLFILLIIPACGWIQKDTQSEPLVSENRCGDGVCDGPENIENCAEDCTVIVIGQSSEDEDAENTESDSASQNTTGLGNTKKFHVLMTIVFESDISKIPGYDGSPYSEPVGYGLVDLEVGFPSKGGYSLYNSGSVTLVNYEEKGPYCTLETPEGMIGAVSEISWGQINWEPDERMTFENEIAYDNLDFMITANCPPLSAPVVEYPIYKLVGIFNEELLSFSIDLREPSHYFENIHWGMHDTMQTNIDVVVEEIP